MLRMVSFIYQPRWLTYLTLALKDGWTNKIKGMCMILTMLTGLHHSSQQDKSVAEVEPILWVTPFLWEIALPLENWVSYITGMARRL